MRVLLVDDHELMWNGARRLIDDVARALGKGDVAFKAVRDVPQALALAAEPFELVLLDFHLPGLSGLAALREIRSAFERAAVCVISGDSSATVVREVLEAGAAGFIPKSYPEPEMAAALGLVLRNRVYVPAEFLFAEEVSRTRAGDEIATEELRTFLRQELSPRQRQVLRLALTGQPNKAIARQLAIAEGTVKVHLSMVYRALGVPNRVAALCRVLDADAAAALND